MTLRGPFPVDLAPFDGAEFRVRMGLHRLDEAHWIDIDEAYEDQVTLARDLLRERPTEVVVALDDDAVRGAAIELHEAVATWFEHHRPSGTAQLQPVDDWFHPIAAVGASTQEDWVLMCPVGGPDAPLVLGCAAVCFPTRWVLTEKLGRPVSEIHTPVPYYEEHVGSSVDRYLERLVVGRPVWRVNWNLCDDDALHQPYVGGRPGAAPIDRSEVGARVWLRLERQTLRRLERSNAVAFGIRVHHQPLEETARTPDLLRRVRAALRAMPAAAVEYKGLAELRPVIDDWCAEQLN